MGDMLLNGRPAGDCGLPEQVIKRGASQGMQQALDLLAGLLPCSRCGVHGHRAEDCTRPVPAGEPPERAARPVTDLILELGR